MSRVAAAQVVTRTLQPPSRQARAIAPVVFWSRGLISALEFGYVVRLACQNLHCFGGTLDASPQNAIQRLRYKSSDTIVEPLRDE